jgi:hypothetical protein
MDFGVFLVAWLGLKDLVLTPVFLLTGILYFMRRP